MSQDIPRVLDSHVIDDLLDDGNNQYSWYENQAVISERLLDRVTWAGLICGLLASATAALPIELFEQFSSDLKTDSAAIKWVTAVFALLATLFASTLAPRYRRRAMDREKGRIATAGILNIARLTLEYKKLSAGERLRLLDEVQRQLLAVERRYGTHEGNAVGEAS